MPKGVEWIFDILTNISQNIQNMQVQKTKQKKLLAKKIQFSLTYTVKIHLLFCD